MTDERKKNTIEDVEDPTPSTPQHHYAPAWMTSEGAPNIPNVPIVPDTPTPPPTPEVEVDKEVEEEEVVEEVALDEALEFVNEDGTPAAKKNTIDDILASIHESTNNPTDAATQATTEKGLLYAVSLSEHDDVYKRLVDDGMKLGADAMVEELNKPSSYLYHLRAGMDYLNSQVGLMRKFLEDAASNNQKLSEKFQRTIENIGVTTAKGIPNNVIKSKVISGKDALVTVASLMQGVKRVPLWNSGFYVTLKAPSIRDIIAYYNSINVDGYEFGRENGAYYFMYADYRLKKQVLEYLLPQCLVGSNYKHWKNNKKLIRALSLQDYDVILWALATMIYREGVNIRVVCAEPNCDYAEEVLIDLTNLRQPDKTKITPEAIAMMNSTEVKSDKDLAKYIKALKFPDTFRFKTNNKATDEDMYWCFDIVPANCADYLEQGDILHNNLLAETADPTEEDVVTFFSINHYRSFIPWIANVKCITKEGYEAEEVLDEHVIFSISGSDLSNKEVLNHILDITQMETSDLPQFIENYASRTKITLIAYYFGRCPVCDKEPDTGVQGFMPHDMQMHFFMMSLMRILKTA